MGLRVFVVGERDARSYEHVVFYGYSGGDEDEGANLAVVSYRYAFFYVNERVYLSVLPDRAAVEVYLIINSGGLPDF